MSAVAHIIERWRSALHPSTATALKVTRLGPGSALLRRDQPSETVIGPSSR